MNINKKILNVTAENWINMNSIFSYFGKNVSNKLNKLVVNCNGKKHLDYYSSGHLLNINFKEFKFTSFKRALNLTFKL
jgi:hypothetical protein